MYATHVPVSLERIPGNACCPKYARANVSSSGVLTTATMARGGSWVTSGKRKLKASELRALRSDLRTFNPADLKGDSAGCNGAPIGDIGGYDLRVGKHESNCPPKSANRLIRLLSRWLPASN